MSQGGISLPSDANSTGRTFGKEELENLHKVIESGTLNCTKGTFVTKFEQKFAQQYGVDFCRCTTSGTAALHAAIAAIDPEPGDEIITTSITDMGAITPIIYQTAIPVFADVDPLTYNVTVETIAPHITSKTKAIIVTHLFGNPCDMDPIMELAREKNIPVIEDACQALLCHYKGKLIGTIGDIGCFSFQQGKHITSGEGGVVVCNNEHYARRMKLFIDKAWGYGDPNPDHYFLAINYRMTELQGAVLLAQMDKLESVVNSRRKTAQQFTEKIQGIPGIECPKITQDSEHVYWKYCIRVDENVIEGGVINLAAKLKAVGIFCAPRYIQKPAFMCEVLRDKKTFGKSMFPFKGPHRQGMPEIIYDPADYPGTIEALKDVLVLPWNELYTEEHIQFIADNIINITNEQRV